MRAQIAGYGARQVALDVRAIRHSALPPLCAFGVAERRGSRTRRSDVPIGVIEKTLGVHAASGLPISCWRG